MNTVGPSIARLRETLRRIAQRPAMCMLEEDFRQVVAFVWGCATASPEHFRLLNAWSTTRLRGAQEKFGWPYALAVLAADRVSHHGPQAGETTTPLVREFLTLVCEYLADLEADDGPADIQAEYERVRREYAEAHGAAHSHGTVLNSDRWEEECAEWMLDYVPALRRAPHPVNPWGQ